MSGKVMSMTIQKFSRVFLGCAGSLLLAAVGGLGVSLAPAAARSGDSRRTSTVPLQQARDRTDATTAPQLTREDLEAWLDGLFPYALAQGELAGAMVAVVKDNQMFFEKGYGYSSLEAKSAVDPERTLFRFGSVSKLFTWTAIMQLVEEGKLDLDRDVNEYLDFQIPEEFGKPITLRNLMTHTGGFEERIGAAITDLNHLPSLGDFVKVVPTRIFPPGEVPAYSNYGATLAGYIVQRVSGEDFRSYIERHIFQPLAMQHSTFRQPLPEQLTSGMAKGYKTALEPAQVFEMVGPIPAGALSGTAADMGRFMIGHLREDGGGLLRPETAQLMHNSIFRVIPPLHGMTLGFFETDRNGRRVISHSGDTLVFHSDLELLLDEHVGLFISLNSTGQDGAAHKTITAVFEQFMDRYFPAPAPEEATIATALEHERFLTSAGRFQDTRREESSFVSLLCLFDQETVSVNVDGTITLPSAEGVNGQPKTWHEIAPYVWREVHGKERLAVKMSFGKVVLLSTDSDASSEPLQPVPMWKSASWNLPLLVSAAIVLLLEVISWPVAALARRRFGAQLALSERELLAHRGARLAVLAWVLFLLGWVLLFAAALSDFTLLSGRLNSLIRLLQFIGLLGIAGAGVATWNAMLTCRGRLGKGAKLWSLLLAASCLSTAWFCFAFHLISVGLQY
jgi:CubicO group peptidase (beta-lactamase class C family)